MAKFKKALGFLLFLAFAVSAFGGFAVLASSGVTVEINGQRVNFEDQPPIIIDGRTLVPVRGVFEMLGYSVEWEQSTSTATLSSAANTILITVGSPVFINNGRAHNLDVPAQVINGRTMIPLRAVVESVGLSLGWNEQTQTIAVSTPTADITTNFFVGEWVLRQQGSFAYIYFNADGTFTSQTHYDLGAVNPTITGTFTINDAGNLVLITATSSWLRGEYVVINDGMSFDVLTNTFERRFDRAGSYFAQQALLQMPFIDPFIGEWVSRQQSAAPYSSIILNFHNDGVFIYTNVLSSGIISSEGRGTFTGNANRNLVLTLPYSSVLNGELTLSTDRSSLENNNLSFTRTFGTMRVDVMRNTENATAQLPPTTTQPTTPPVVTSPTTTPPTSSNQALLDRLEQDLWYARHRVEMQEIFLATAQSMLESSRNIYEANLRSGNMTLANSSRQNMFTAQTRVFDAQAELARRNQRVRDLESQIERLR